MLKKKALRKIMVTTISCFILLLLYVIPVKLNDNYIDPEYQVIYTSNIYNSEIYLLSDNNYLVKYDYNLKNDKLKKQVEEILKLLNEHSLFNKPKTLTGIIPKNTKVNDIKIEDNRVYIDFNSNLLDISKEKEERLIEAIVYSVTSINKIDEVVITIDGKKLTHLDKSNIELPSTLSRSIGINKVYDITNRNGIQKIVLYYTENISNNNYYIPVTKYINDDRDKIKIIVENLSSNYIYEDNLSSYLRNDVDLVNYEEADNTLFVNFNKDIFPSDKLLESVEYTLSYSIFDNYDVDKIMFQVNGKDLKEISKCKIKNYCKND